ncbi:hypothetical protein NH340_JMT07248 [Sarcoptes scabiei]|nr:hypothetical protein NH340_JMT07248 [Sarcoptes scabiei]
MISNKIEPTKSLNEQRPAFGEKPLVCLFDPHDKRIHSLRSNDVKDLIQIVTLPTNFVLKRIKNNHESKNQNQHQLNIGCGVSEPKIQSNSHPGDYDTSDEDKIVDKRTNGTANDPHEMNRKSNISRNSDDEIRLSNKSDIIGSSNTKHNTNIIQSDHPITKNNNSNMIANCGDINVNIDQNNYNQTSFHIVHNNNENKIDQRPFHSYRYCPVNRSMTNIHNSSEISASSSSSSTTTATDTNDNRSYMSNLNSVSIVSSSSNNIDQSSDIIPLSSLNTSALVRTISNGSTFGPLPSWSLGQSNCSDLANRSCFQNNPDHSNHFKPSNESGSSSNSNNNQVVGQSSLCANNNIGSILATTFPAQNYPPVKLNLPLIFGENFILTGQIEASNLYRCIEMRNKEEYWCRVSFNPSKYTIS